VHPVAPHLVYPAVAHLLYQDGSAPLPALLFLYRPLSHPMYPVAAHLP
jgi:hypothetical protein